MNDVQPVDLADIFARHEARQARAAQPKQPRLTPAAASYLATRSKAAIGAAVHEQFSPAICAMRKVTR